MIILVSSSFVNWDNTYLCSDSRNLPLHPSLITYGMHSVSCSSYLILCFSCYPIYAQCLPTLKVFCCLNNFLSFYVIFFLYTLLPHPCPCFSLSSHSAGGQKFSVHLLADFFFHSCHSSNITLDFIPSTVLSYCISILYSLFLPLLWEHMATYIKSFCQILVALWICKDKICVY